MKLEIEGVLTAIVTPFASDGSLDLQSLDGLVDRHIAAGIRGIVVAGTTGEAPVLTAGGKRAIFVRVKDRGGIVLLGVDDEGQILGLETEFQSLRKPNRDGFENMFNMAFNKMVAVEFRPYLTLDFVEVEGNTVGRIMVLPSRQPAFLLNDGEEEFYIRTGNSSQPLTLRQAVRYILTHLGQS